MMSLSFCFPLDILSSALFCCCGVWCMSACLPTPLLSFRRLSSPASRLERTAGLLDWSSVCSCPFLRVALERERDEEKDHEVDLRKRKEVREGKTFHSNVTHVQQLLHKYTSRRQRKRERESGCVERVSLSGCFGFGCRSAGLYLSLDRRRCTSSSLSLPREIERGWRLLLSSVYARQLWRKHSNAFLLFSRHTDSRAEGKNESSTWTVSSRLT